MNKVKQVNKHILKKLGKRIQMLRMQRGITQEQLAELICSDRSYIGAIEQGRKSPSVYCLYEISVALETELKELFLFNI